MGDLRRDLAIAIAGCDPDKFGPMDEPWQQSYLKMADRALAVMQEPRGIPVTDDCNCPASLAGGGHDRRCPRGRILADRLAERLTGAAEMLWVVLANVSGGDWTKQDMQWRLAAAAARDHYFDVAVAQGRQSARKGDGGSTPPGDSTMNSGSVKP